MKHFRSTLLLLLLAFPSIIFFNGSGSPGFLVAADDDVGGDVVEGEEDGEATVETDEGEAVDEGGSEKVSLETAPSGSEEEEESTEPSLKASPDAETNLIFIRPLSGNDFPAGVPVKLLVGFYNKGSKDFIVDTMEASFHYPQDYSYYIQNYTAFRYHQTVEPSHEATFEYGFTPSETFASRAFALTVRLNYQDTDGNLYQDAVFNATVNMVELDEGFDGEAFFLYIFLAAVAALLLFVIYHFILTGKKKLISSKPRSAPIETGTQGNKMDVDYDWLPKETLDIHNRSPGRASPKSKASPRLRTAAASKRRTGGADD